MDASSENNSSHSSDVIHFIQAIRVFNEHTEFTILASQALLRENKNKIQQQNVTPLSIELHTSAI